MVPATSRNALPSRAPADALLRAFSSLLTRRADDVLVVAPTARATASNIDQLAGAMRAEIAARGLQAGGIVGFAAPNGPAFLAGVIALRRAGHPVLLMDHLAPHDDRTRVLSAVGACGILECRNAWPSSTTGVHLASLSQPGLSVAPDIAFIKLTSGSTGTPRGVSMTAEQLLADESALATTMGLQETDRLLAMIPMSHSYGFTTLVLSALVRGLPLVTPSDHGPFAPIDAARRFEATIVPTVPAYVQALLRMSQPPPWPDQLRRVITAGAVLPPSTAHAFRARYGHAVHAFYGSSECGGICYDREGGAAERGTVGAPVDGVRITLSPVDADPDEGLVTIRSQAVGGTYLPDPDRRLRGGCFETSDIGVWAGGELALRRRADAVINIRGRKVDPAEVERVLAALDGVADVVVVATGSRDGDSEIVRAIVACPSGQLDYEAIAQWCQARLADHKVPRSIVIVDAIPRTPRGKVDRVALASLVAAEQEQARERG